MLKDAVRAALAAALLAAPAAAQMAPPSDEAVSLRFYNYNLSRAGAGKDATQEMIDSFMAANPQVSVEGVPTPPAEVMNIIQADVIAGNGPDIAQVIFSDLGYVAENFGIPSLEEIVPPEEWEAHIAGMVPNGLELGRILDKTYGLAYVFSTPVLFYNADLFREAGLDPEQPPATWAEVKTAAIAISEKTGKPGLLTGIFGPSAYDWLYQGVIYSNGGDIISPDRKELLFAEPEGVEAVEMLRELAQSGAMPNTPVLSAIEQMGSGNVGMYLQTSAVQARMLKAAEGVFEMRAAAMPAFGGKPVKPTNSGSALVIMTQDPVKQRAAWELMKHLTSDYGYTIIATKIGYLPLRPSAVESEEYLAPWLRANPLAEPNLAQLKDLAAWEPHVGPNYKQILSTMMNASERAVFGEDDDVAGILLDAQKRAQALMPR